MGGYHEEGEVMGLEGCVAVLVLMLVLMLTSTRTHTSDMIMRHEGHPSKYSIASK